MSRSSAALLGVAVASAFVHPALPVAIVAGAEIVRRRNRRQRYRHIEAVARGALGAARKLEAPHLAEKAGCTLQEARLTLASLVMDGTAYPDADGIVAWRQ